MTSETLAVASLITTKIVELFYIALFAYVAKLLSVYFMHRLTILGPDARVFVRRVDVGPDGQVEPNAPNRINPFESSTYENRL